MKKWFAGAAAVAFVALGLTATGGGEAKADHDKTDYAEVYLVLPNELTSWICNTGAPAPTQTNLDLGGLFPGEQDCDQALPDPTRHPARLGLVRGILRADWTLDRRRPRPVQSRVDQVLGTWNLGQGRILSRQTSEGINVTVEIGIAASVPEQNAAKFLYYFGVKPPAGDRKDPAVIFTSVYQGRSLAEVMDGVVRGKVSALVCAEIGARPLDKANAEINQIMTKIQDNVSAFLETRGITLDYVGQAGTWTFDQPVQDAINRRYIAGQDEVVAETLAPYAQTIMTLAVAEGVRSAVGKFDGKLPQTLSGLWLLPSKPGSRQSPAP